VADAYSTDVVHHLRADRDRMRETLEPVLADRG
jgi:hypothetical protein